ncbi:MAG: HDOD domain-containing protein, partial [Pseudomonadota bacterium]
MNPKELVSGVVRLVSLPEVCLRVSEMLEDPAVSTAELGRVISRDAGLTARLLKIVNGKSYGFPARIETVSRAVEVV